MVKILKMGLTNGREKNHSELLINILLIALELKDNTLRRRKGRRMSRLDDRADNRFDPFIIDYTSDFKIKT